MEKGRNFYITTPIYYPSDNLHIGHAYTTVAADCIARFKRMQGYQVYYLTGTDEHGQKIARAASDNNMTPQAYIDGIVSNIRRLWETLLISNTGFIRTTEARHQQVVKKLFQQVYDQGDIYISEYEGWYCLPCETFFTERQLKDGKCPDCEREVELLKEESYFFKMSRYADRLLKHIDENPEFIQPESRRHEVINFIKGGLDDLCVSRTSFKWGIPVPFNEKHVVYVWFDALINYLTGIGYAQDDSMFAEYWPADVHLMAKDILRFHAIIWPIMLMAVGLPLPKKIFAHGWIMLEGGKMSKSKGNVIDPGILVDKYGADAIRYYLIKEMSYGQDGMYSEEMLVNRINSDLANDLGNLVSRTAAMVIRYFSGQIPAPEEYAPIDEELKQAALQAYQESTAKLEKLDFAGYLISCMKLVARANKYIDETEPWRLAKDESSRGRLGAVLYNLLECIRITTVLMAPAMPQLPLRVNAQLNLFPSPEELEWDSAGEWALVPAGNEVKKGEVLFPRIDLQQMEESNMASEQEVKKDVPAATAVKEELKEEKEYITYDDFSRLDLRVAEIVECEKMEKADKLLILKVKLGEEQRTIVAGIAQHYEPAELIGKKVVIVANLQPAKLRGTMSEGMLLAASDDNRVEVLMVQSDIAAGNRVK